MASNLIAFISTEKPLPALPDVLRELAKELETTIDIQGDTANLLYQNPEGDVMECDVVADPINSLTAFIDSVKSQS